MIETEEKTRTDFTEGSVFGSIFKMGLPSMVGYMAQHLYVMANMFWVARLPESESAVAGITFFNNFLFFLFALNSMVGPGSVAVISRRYGERAFDEAETAIKECLTLKLFFGGIMALFGIIFLEEMLTLLGARDEALQLATGYGQILLFGLPIQYATFTIFTAMRGVANPTLAMGLMLGANVFNAALDPVLIFGYLGFPALGVNGAAWASVITFSLSLIIGFILFRTRFTNIKLGWGGRSRMSVASMWKIVRIGIPAFIGEISFSGSRLLITPIVAAYGTNVVAAYGVGMQLSGFGIMILVGLGLGLSSLIGHNMGAGKLDRARSTADHSILAGIATMAAFGLVTFFGAEYYLRLFFDSPTTIHHGVEMLRILAVGFPFIGAFLMIEQIYVGVGQNVPPMVAFAVHGWAFQVLPAILATSVFGLGQTAVWWVLSLSGVVTSAGFYLYYRRGQWLTSKV
jgi:putative MATE family efflux protein